MHALLMNFLDEEQANLIFCMLICIPLSFLLSFIKQKYLFLVLSITITFTLQSFLFPTEKYFLWTQQQIVYLLIMYSPRKCVGHIVLGESFLALTLIQIRRIYVFYAVNGVDITGIFMMQVFVWVGMAYNYQNSTKDPLTLTQDAKKRLIKQRPSYITYLGCVNFLPACLIGPVYEFKDFEDYLHRQGDYKYIPSPLKAMCNQLLIFILTLIVYVCTINFDLNYILSVQYSQLNIVFKLLYVFGTIFHIELKYISAWSLGLISMKASGFTYNPSKNVLNSQNQVVEYNFDRVRTTDFIKFYITPSIKDKAEGWNMSVQAALKKYIYEQIHNPLSTYKDEKQKINTINKAQLITLMTSAVWHGFYFGYFISFFHWSLCFQVNTEFYKFRIRSIKFKKIYEKYKIISVLQSLMWNFLLIYFGTTIHLMIWARIKIFLWETYALPYVGLYVVWFLLVKMKLLVKIRGYELNKKEKIKEK